jgi:YD repeat-containing protein
VKQWCTSLVQGYGYTYGDNVNLTGITDLVAAANSNTLTYTPANRLASASGAWGSNSFSYDSVGNRIDDLVTGTVNQSRVASYAATSNRITGMSENGASFRSYTYDGAGNIVTDQRPFELYQYTYNNRNRMSSVTRNGAAYATYIYNALEQLASRTTADPNGPVGTVHYIYDTNVPHQHELPHLTL